MTQKCKGDQSMHTGFDTASPKLHIEVTRSSTPGFQQPSRLLVADSTL